MKKLFKYYPVIAVIAFELSTLGHIFRMINEQSAIGQEPVSWILCVVGLIGWAIWYKLYIPDQRTPMYTAILGAFVNTIALITTLYFK